MLAYDIQFQNQLITAALDDFTPNSVLPHTRGGQYGKTPEAWRAAVLDFLQDTLAAGLVAPLAGLEGYQAKSVDELCALLRDGDEDTGLDAELAWDVIHFGATPKLTELLQGLGLARWDARDGALSQPLAQAIVAMGAARA